ncbi:MAG: carbamoyltransferase C-terminal domain-containing protein [bacterium]
MPVVLGLHAFGHEAGACLATPGGLYALSEERLSRQKYDGGFPERSIRWALEAGGVELGAVELVVYDLIESGGDRVLQALEGLGYQGPVRACRHHDAHAASAFYASPFDEAAVLTLDAGGSREGELGPGVVPSPWHKRHPEYREVQAQYRGVGSRLHTLRRTVVGPPFSINPGVLYGLTSIFLGCGELGAGKVMGLAGHGRPEAGFRKPLFRSFAGDPLAPCPLKDPLQPRAVTEFLPTLFDGAQPRGSEDPITDRHRAVAAHVQQQTSDAVLGLVRHLVAVTGLTRLCLAGGFGLNVLTNSAILEQTPVTELFVQPAATDSGIPLGCALWGYHAVLGEPRRFRMETAALGGSYSAAEIERACAAHPGLVVQKRDDVVEVAAAALAQGRIVGWLEGRSELGPRALGQRSILADPRDPSSVRRLNTEIKHRESYRPYAPMVVASRADTYFALPAPSPFMLLAAEVRSRWRERLSAVTHVDGTARVQTVTPEQHPRLVRLLEAFEQEAGVPVLLNTSFNRAGEPIVETPADALDMLLGTGLDALALEDYWVEKPGLPAATDGE